MTYADDKFKETLQLMLETGVSDEGQEVRPKWLDGTPAHTLSTFGVVTRYDLSKEFPITTLRRTAFKSAIDEILWIWQKKSNDVAELNSKIWDQWASEVTWYEKDYLGSELGELFEEPEEGAPYIIVEDKFFSNESDFFQYLLNEGILTAKDFTQFGDNDGWSLMSGVAHFLTTRGMNVEMIADTNFDLYSDVKLTKKSKKTIGNAYGYQLGVKHKYAEGWFDQVDRVLYDLKNNPNSRRIMTNIYNHEDLFEMGLYPCAYSMTFNVKDGKLNAILNQRSQDFITANNWNVVQYAILVHMFAQVSGFEVGEFIHVISDCHIYDRHVPIAEELLTKKSMPAPKLEINPEVKDFYDFTVDDFKLVGYTPDTTKYKIEVAE